MAEGARRMQKEWGESLKRQCSPTIPFFFKQWGDASPDRVIGTRHGGDLLDGRQYHEFPEVFTAHDQLAEDMLVYQPDRDAETRFAARD